MGCFKGECLNSPKGVRRHSQTEPPKAKANANIGTKSVKGRNGAEDMVAKKEQGHEDVWTKLVGRASQDKIFINWQPGTALLDTGCQVTHVSQDFCLPNGIKINPINQFKEGFWVLDQLNLEGLNAWTADQQQAAKDLLVDSADVFSKQWFGFEKMQHSEA